MTEDQLELPLDLPPRSTSVDEGGYKADEAKNRLELIPPELVFGVGEVLTFGANKYAARNWELGMHWSRVFGAVQRHLWAFWGGEDLDPETGLPHIYHAACGLAFLSAFINRPEHAAFDDRPTSDPTTRVRANGD